MKSMMSDLDLIIAFGNGDNSAMDILINRYHKVILGYICHLVNNKELAEDLTQDVFIKAINSLRHKEYQESGYFKAWLMRIAHNLVIDYVRKKQKLPTVPNEIGEIDLLNNIKFSDETIESKIIKFQIKKDLKDLIMRLPEEQKSTILMRLNLDMSFKEIAELQGISINTALGRMRYAILNLRKMIDEKNVIMSL